MADLMQYFSSDYSLVTILCLIVPLLCLVYTISMKKKTKQIEPLKLKSYPIIGSFLQVWKNRERFEQWTAEIVNSTPSLTFTLHHTSRRRDVISADPAVVQHILKIHFSNYEKGGFFRSTMRDFLGDGIFNADGDNWKFQRQVASHEFNTRSLRKFVENVVDSEMSDRLIPILKNAADNGTVLDLQDVLQRFAFDNICKIAFGYDPAYLQASLPEAPFASAFDLVVKVCSERLAAFSPLVWKIKRALNIGSEKQLKIAAKQVRELATEIIREKKQDGGKVEESQDLLSRFLCSGHSDEDFVRDIVISFILAGRDTTSAALTWFFWLISGHPDVEHEILKEVMEKSEHVGYDELKDMTYTHASLCETMRLYPPVPMDFKEALNDDVLPDGTIVKKGMRVGYHVYAMGRVEKAWGKDWADFRPARWLKREAGAEKWSFVNRDSYTYPVFQAGPRICLGKEMAFLQMKRVVAGVLPHFKVEPVLDGGANEPILMINLTEKVKGGFPVKIQERDLNIS